MKKITVIAALLGGICFAQAQVGIGTSRPKDSALLDLTASDKGILIPRVELTSSNVFAPIVGDKEEGLLVYNTKKAGSGDTAVEPGFYFWKKENNGHWERVSSKGDIETVINNMGTDVESIVELLQKAYPSNKLGDSPTTEKAGGMVYTPGENGGNSKIGYVVYDTASSGYKTIDVTSEFEAIVSGTESNTTIVSYKNEQYYLSESYMRSGASTDTSTWQRVPDGAIKIEVVGAISENIKNILENVIVEVDGRQYSFEDYIEYISETTKKDGETKIVLDTDGQAEFQTWDKVGEAWKVVSNDKFSRIVKANETQTTLTRSENGQDYAKLALDPKAQGKVVYEFTDEKGETSYIDLGGDIKYVIENNNDIYESIQNIINQGGNVYYGKIAGGTENVLYMKDTSVEPAVDTPIDISQTIINNITTNMTDENINIFKNQLGNTINVGGESSSFTGDTYVKGGVTYYIYKGLYSATIEGKTADIKSNGGKIRIDKPVFEIVSINLKYGIGTPAPVTGLTLSGNDIAFKIGSGSYYIVLSAEDLSVDVVVEFASTQKPAGIE
ncbi:hypothetical protein [Myroides odoratus]|uniref:Uncharacterized protein n=1 Tax=Myroides odoratus TaxID=256 RepID=A0A9Q7E976_MYROD|nr:hypothetical protein [Myroides odoratus]EHQ44249.1 hypothetical protein Myrod_3445 [Myroides odoratus DSM 2801]EKB05856.1 hypothetical protein HMPREF9716_02649 [Myroides odoratus CIP 103059]QQU01531.1 hypothetical protein I6I88_07265 [Myroides odoratus]WQD56199.1 hypothetical protein U0010_11745 [Myroides odoratus]STZ31586.1 Uncharacterised protein [Myroides odoratus]